MKKKRITTNLRNADGEDIPPNRQAEEMATHLETKQWYARDNCNGFATSPLFGTDLPMDDGDITCKELCQVISKLKSNKASGPDAIPPEFWKALAKDGQALEHFRGLCNQCWRQRRIPKSCHKASVVSIFKKGAMEDMANYRPISLLQISYKIFASWILLRLKAGHAEERICKT